MNVHTKATIKSWETRRGERLPEERVQLRIALPSEHFRDALKAEAEVRNMSVNSFMRAMIRGYFAAALHGR